MGRLPMHFSGLFFAFAGEFTRVNTIRRLESWVYTELKKCFFLLLAPDR
jgi:hypothetical protein